MDVIGVKRQRHVIRLDESEGSPEYTYDLGRRSIERLQPAFGAAFRVIDAFARGASDDMEALGKAYGDVVAAALGDEARDEIVGYVTCGSGDPEDAAIYLAPVVKYLFEKYAEAVAAGREELAGRYLAADGAR